MGLMEQWAERLNADISKRARNAPQTGGTTFTPSMSRLYPIANSADRIVEEVGSLDDVHT